jgi:hypothetical protein
MDCRQCRGDDITLPRGNKVTQKIIFLGGLGVCQVKNDFESMSAPILWVTSWFRALWLCTGWFASRTLPKSISLFYVHFLRKSSFRLLLTTRRIANEMQKYYSLALHQNVVERWIFLPVAIRLRATTDFYPKSDLL